MCSINGFNFKDEELILKMDRITAHRGPDGTGVFEGGGITLGHNRLSILDLSLGASQPMKSADGRFVITFNGEIYNFQELKTELSGHSWKTEGDTEVILAAYAKWGKDSVKKLNGIFAFAIWDTVNKELFLARDQVGLKPLYYYAKDRKFIFSSEIKALLEHPIARKLDREAFSIYLRTLYVPAPLTMFEGICKFPQGHYGFVKDGNLSLTAYADTVPEPRRAEPRSVLKEELYEKVKEGVKRQLISDRPIGLYLSGGIDSSAVLHVMSELRGDIDTFSVGFSLPDKREEAKFNADFYLARETAKKYGTQHHEVLFTETDALTYLEKAVYSLDEPISNPTAFPMMKLAEFTKREGVDVVLGGDGGDELFGGYERYRLSLWASVFQKLPAPIRRFISVSGRFKKLNTPAGIERFALFMFQKDAVLSRVLKAGAYDADAANLFFSERFFSQAKREIPEKGGLRGDGPATSGLFLQEKSVPFFGDFERLFLDVDRRTWLPDESLMRTDKMSMAAGVEARAPLLDNELVKFAAEVPLKYKVSLVGTKLILKEAFRGRIPDVLFKQPKRGWFSPGAKWLRNPAFLAEAKVILSAGYYGPTADLFDWEGVAAMLEAHRSGEKYNFNMLWALLSFQVWAKRYNIAV